MIQIVGRGEADASDSRRGKRQGLLPLLGRSVYPTGDFTIRGLPPLRPIRRSFGNLPLPQPYGTFHTHAIFACPHSSSYLHLSSSSFTPIDSL